ncbi:SARP family transcriptional regulator [Peteryoungia ipomoeae]|uniref:SARP family transcriptional regulator n=1 Tax=Peteryoungia ipomoeae TaxID=1210932 RepID=UPI003CCC7DBE
MQLSYRSEAGATCGWGLAHVPPLPMASIVAEYRLDTQLPDVLTSVSSTAGISRMERMDETHAAFRIYLLGPFTIKDGRGQSLTPRSQKAQAILAMLALSARGMRSRVWLRDKLWSDRSEDQAAASLRQALLDIHRSLGPDRGLLVADKNTVWLDMQRIWLDTEEVLAAECAAERVTDQLLEGMDIRDPEFEDWLTLERQNWHRRIDEGRIQDTLEPRRQPSRDISKQSLLLPVTRGPDKPWAKAEAPGDASGGRPPSGDLQWMVALQPPIVIGAADRGHIGGTLFQNLLIKAISDGLGIGVTDLSFASREAQDDKISLPLCLQLRLTFEGDMVLIELSIKHLIDNRMIWLSSQTLSRTSLERGEFGIAVSLIAQAVDQLSSFQETSRTDERMLRERLLMDGVHAIFRLSRDDLSRAEKRLQEQIEYQPRSSAYAWLSFIRTFQVGQRFTAMDAHVIDEAQAYARKALEIDPHNSVSLALVGHVHSFLFREYDYAANLFEKSIMLNPAQPLGWDLYAMLHCYAGQPDKAAAMARWVQELGIYSPHRFYFDTTKCISAGLAGNHQAAIAAGEDALRARPNFNSLLRYMVSSHAHTGNLEAARRYLERLDALEGGFTIHTLRSSGYPLLDTGGGQLLIDGLIKAGVKLR